MNRGRYQLVFSRARGCLVAVGEGARRAGKRASGQASRASVALAALLLSAAHAQIVADPAAPGPQRATVLAAPNGVPLVNITTPSAAGVSRNTWRQFDVGAPGAILNNSRTDTPTQLGGWVQGNPWLAAGSARVILNEVNSAHPSHLNGWVEVAGQRAEVVIANPAGIQVNGASFINASAVTLTTGAPVFHAGELDAYRVQGGQVTIEGGGLDTRGAEATAILARAVQVNAGLWAHRLQVVTGTHTVAASDHTVAARDHTVAAAATPTGDTPAFALDVAQIGGMYAGHIHLVGTEVGLGVNIATHGDIRIQAGNDMAARAASVQAGGDLSVQAGQDITLQAGRARSHSESSLYLNVSLQAAQEHHRETSLQDGKSASLGVAIGASGMNANASASRSKGAGHPRRDLGHRRQSQRSHR